MSYVIVEKHNHLAIHAICSTRESAERWLTVAAPTYVQRGYFMDKSLTADSFEILEKP
jgi:hypothetical protein